LGGAGYPSVLAMSPKKNVYSKMRAAFNKENLDKFINNLIRGKE
jgi:protein disulfide-isomerase A6